MGVSRTVDEETPLLDNQSQNTQQNESPRQKTPLPWRQFSILLLLRAVEPLSSQVIAPFLPQLIKNIGITRGKDSSIGYYVGLMHSLFFLTEACTTYHWSRISDRIGRRPILLVGVFGLSISMWCFGLSRTFWTLVLSRCLCGALNGNIGVMKSMVAEITDSTNVAEAYGILPIPWSIGTTLGPLIGGLLARPADRFPDIFGHSGFFKRYPYFLPCSVVGSFAAVAWFLTYLFMKETANPPMTIKQYFCGDDKSKTYPQDHVHEVPHDGPAAAPEETEEQLPFRALLVRPVIIAAASYATFSLIDIAFRAIIPVFYALPIETGGLGLTPLAIGNILGLQGMSGGILQWQLFPRVHDRIGSKPLYLISVSLCLPMIALFPVINAAARAYGLSYFVWFLVGLQMALFVFAYFAFAITFMYVSAAAPNKASIGATNGLAQILVSIMRAIGPAAVNSAYSISLEANVMGGYFVYWVMVAMVALSLWVGCLLPREPSYP
ncbi:Major facilitator superfamily domain containing protein [Tylopilus felleus]